MAGSLARPYAPVALIVVKLRKSRLSSYVTAPTRPRCSGNNSSSPSRGAGQLPRAVISAATGRAGVTSKACLGAGVRRPATRRLLSVQPSMWVTSRASRRSIGIAARLSVSQSIVGEGNAI
jgi:hypothetical protein